MDTTDTAILEGIEDILDNGITALPTAIGSYILATFVFDSGWTAGLFRFQSNVYVC
jgi:hypothetical protein